MNTRITTTLGSVALVALLAGISRATVLNFAMNSAGAVPANNSDLDVPYGSNVGPANIIGATDGGEGWTPNIALAWAPTGGTVPAAPDIDVLEFHSAGTFTGAGFTVPVLQLDIDASNHTVLPEDPWVDFTPDAGWAVRIHELKFGNATDQSENAYSTTISVLELPGLTPTGSSHTTAALTAGQLEVATLNFTGAPGVSYRLLFHDNTDPANGLNPHPRAAIDDLRFSQVIPEPSTLALVALCGLGLITRRK